MEGEDRDTWEAVWHRGAVATRAIAGLARPWLIARQGRPTCALIPAGTRGWAREAMFAWLILELERQRDTQPQGVIRSPTDEP